jgi:hypothetical protein
MTRLISSNLRALVIGASLLLIALLAATWKQRARPEPVALVPALTGQPEYCLSCHADLPEISLSHSIDSMGCVSCHGGDPLALDADLAHSTMRGGRNPSDFSVVEASCGGSGCHSGSAEDGRDHIHRVLTSVQATYAGAIATVRFAFGGQSDQLAHQGVFAIQDPETATGLAELTAFDPTKETSPAIQTFAANCLNCHLSAEPLPGLEYARLTGCAACHTLTAGADLKQPLHQLTTAIPYTQCNTCHNRGNYSMRDLKFNPRTDAPTDRLHDYYQPIAQFTKCEYELDCVDCHTNGEVMGDGDLYNYQKEIQYVQCKTCHGTLAGPPLTRTITDPNDIALRLAFLNPVNDLQAGDTIVVTEKGEPIWNMRQLPDGTFELIGKVTKARYTVPLVAGSTCPQKPDEQESRFCHECHAVER